MNFKFILATSICALSTGFLFAQKASDVHTYIAKYKDLAIAEQKRTGVPAAIKLAQGIHESGCGNSELSINAKNHFGIKCKTNWAGATYTYTDDAKDECFRKYEDDFSSYRDHSDFLKNSKRYASLFTLNVTDYKSWAQGLKKCGYATNPKYAQRIVDLVEKYELNQYSQIIEEGDYGDDDAAKEALIDATAFTTTVEPIANHEEQQSNDSRTYYVVTVKNGLKGFYGKEGDLLLNAAYANNIRYGKLLELNDLTDEPLKEDMFIYLERKNKEGKSETYEIKDGESLLTVAQEQGLRLKDLRNYNHLKAGEEPEVGVVLHLKNTAPKKPLLRAPIFGNKSNPDFVKTGNNDGYIAGGAKPATRVENKVPEKTTTTTKAGENEVNRASQIPVQKPIAKEAEEDFNIANEVAVEEQIAAERKQTEVVNKVEQPIEREEPPAEMSDLDRLKAKLDKSVYGNNKPNNSKPANTKPTTTTTQSQSNTNQEVYQTRPASAGAQTNNTARNNSTTTSGSGVESLKRRIEAHQSNGSEEPVVANKSNVSNIKPASTKAEAPAKPKAEAKKPSSHTVKKGETATAIAGKYGISVKDLIKLNRLPANGSVKVGQTLKVK